MGEGGVEVTHRKTKKKEEQMGKITQGNKQKKNKG